MIFSRRSKFESKVFEKLGFFFLLFQIQTPIWPELKKVKITSDNKGESEGEDRSWFIERLKMKNRDTKDEIQFEARR